MHPGSLANAQMPTVTSPALPLRRTKAAPPVALEQLSKQKLDVPGASGIVALDQDTFLLVEDDKGIYRAKPDGKAKGVAKTKDHSVLEDLEGICRSPDGAHVLVLSEDSGQVMELALGETRKGNVSLGKPEVLGALPDIDRVNNKGWEGMDLMPGDLFDDGQPRLVAVHEGSPRKVGVFSYPDLETELLLSLPRSAKNDAEDVSDVAVDPKTGHLFLLSDQSATILEMAIVRDTQLTPGGLVDSSRLEHLHTTELDLRKKEKGKKEKPEGLDFGPDGKLWLAMDGKARLYAFDVQRAAAN